MFFSITTCLYLLTIPVIYTNIYPSHATNFINFMFLMNIIINYETILLDSVDKYCRIKYYITSKINKGQYLVIEFIDLEYVIRNYIEYEMDNKEN